MAPRKNRPVLFEVISRTQRSRPPKVTNPRPAGPGNSLPAPNAGSTPVGSPPAPAPSPAPAGGTPGEAAAPKPAMITKFRTSGITTARSLRGGAGGTPARRSSWLAISESGRVHLSLGWQELAIVAVVGIVVAIGSFLLGHRIGHASAAPPATDSRPVENPGLWDAPAPTPSQQEPVRKLIEPVPGQNRAARVDTPRGPSDAPPPVVTERPTPPPVVKHEEPRPAEADFQPQAGAYYVVAQHFPLRYRKEADAARDFLRSKGIPAIVRTGGGDLELVIAESFASEQQAAAVAQRVREAGREYVAGGGGYDLAGARARKQ